jgi:hypothetical protein
VFQIVRRQQIRAKGTPESPADVCGEWDFSVFCSCILHAATANGQYFIVYIQHFHKESDASQRFSILSTLSSTDICIFRQKKLSCAQNSKDCVRMHFHHISPRLTLNNTSLLKDVEHKLKAGRVFEIMNSVPVNDLSLSSSNLVVIMTSHVIATEHTLSLHLPPERQSLFV